MFRTRILKTLVGLMDPAERLVRASELAELLGGEELLIFCRDPAAGAYLPAPGFPQNLRGGLEWQEFLKSCGKSGENDAILPHPLWETRQRWFGFRVGTQGEALVTLRAMNCVAADRIQALLQLLPILVAAFRSERGADRAQGLAFEPDGHEQAGFLSEASRKLSSSLDLEATLQQCGNILVPTLASAVFVYLRESKGLILSRSYGETFDPSDSLQELLAKQLEQVQESHGFGQQKGLLHAVALPLSWRLQLNGVLIAVRKKTGFRSYHEDEVRMLRDFSLRFSVALENCCLYRDTRLAVRAREEFLSIASHELKTPLTTILLGHQLIKRKLRASPQSRAVAESMSPLIDSVEEQLKNLGHLINRLLDVARACQPEMALESSDFDLGDLVSKVVERFREPAKLAGSRIISQVSPAWVRCDQLRMEQAINNLITNAIKYGSGNDIDVSAGECAGLATIRVRDRGIGIPAADQERIFDQFERAVDYRKISGLGLGLYITKRIVESHGGSVRVQSEPGKGSLFEIRVPSRTIVSSTRFEGRLDSPLSLTKEFG